MKTDSKPALEGYSILINSVPYVELITSENSAQFPSGRRSNPERLVSVQPRKHAALIILVRDEKKKRGQLWVRSPGLAVVRSRVTEAPNCVAGTPTCGDAARGCRASVLKALRALPVIASALTYSGSYFLKLQHDPSSLYICCS